MGIGVMLRQVGQHPGGLVYTNELLPEVLRTGSRHEFVGPLSDEARRLLSDGQPHRDRRSPRHRGTGGGFGRGRAASMTWDSAARNTLRVRESLRVPAGDRA